MARTVTTFFNMKENYSGGMRRAARATSQFQRQVTAAARVLDREAKKRREIKIQSRQATGVIADVRKQLDKIKDLRINIAARTQNFKRDMKPVTSDIKNLVKKPLLVTLKLKDMALAGLRKTADILKSLAKGAIITLGIAGGAMTYTLGKGATLQQYQASIEHNVFAANRNLTENQVQTQAKAYTDWLLDFAAKTTASVDDVFAAGAHALAGTGGDMEAAKGILRTAQDMAAQRYGSTTWDAVEAILDMSMGQYRRMTEYGFKVTQEAMDAANGDPFKVKDQTGRTLTDRFMGAEARKASTGAGIWDSIKGTVEGGIAQAGSNILDALTPLLVAMLPYADTLAAKMADMGTSIGDWIANTIPKLGELWDNVKKVMTPFIEWINAKWDLLKPFRDFGANAFAGVDVDGEKVLGGITGAIDQLVNTLINWLNSLAQNWDKIEPVIAGIIQFLPQIALAFAGFKLINWGVKTGKAVGNLFGGGWTFLKGLFGNNKTTVTPPISTPDTVLNKPGTATPKAGPNTNTFNGPNYNTFQGPNYNAGNGNGNGGDGGNPFNNGGIPQTPTPHLPLPGMLPLPLPGMSPLSLPAGSQPLGLPAGPGRTYQNIPTVGKARPGFNFSNLLNGLAGAGLLAAWTTGLENDARLHARAEQEIQKYEIEMPLHVIPDTSGLNGNMVSLINGETINGNLLLNFIPNPAGGNPLNQPILKKNAAGIKRVPFDNYPTLLHKGETVLPSGEAGEYRSRGNRGGGTSINGVTININGANKNGEQLAAEFVRGLERAAFNMA